MSKQEKQKFDWATFFYQHLGYPIVETPEADNALNETMKEAFDIMLKEAADKKRTLSVRILNDTTKPLTIRLAPPNTTPDLKPRVIEPLKMAAVFLEGNKVFLKVWNDNVILLCEDGFK